MIGIGARILRACAWSAAVFWLALAGLTMRHDSTGAIPLLMASNGIAFAVAGQVMLRSRRRGDAFAGAVFGVNAFLSLTDQVGPLDIVSFLLSSGMLAGLILMARRARRGRDLSRSGGGAWDENARVR